MKAEQSRKSVLFVDDEADIRELLVLTLSRMGVDADTASTVREAEESLKTRTYDLRGNPRRVAVRHRWRYP